MSEHSHTERVAGCVRCDLSAQEIAPESMSERAASALADFIVADAVLRGDTEGADDE